jgi:hypothetical protein
VHPGQFVVGGGMRLDEFKRRSSHGMRFQPSP